MNTTTNDKAIPAYLNAEHRANELRRDFGLLTPKDVAAIICVDTGTLAVWRSQKRGPDVTKLGRAVFYRKKDVDAWIALNTVPMNRCAA